VAQPATHHTEHQIRLQAPPEIAYRTIADVARWPYTFTPTIHAERLEGDDREELIRIWALANGEVKTWISRRQLDPVARRVEFRQEESQHPVAAMSGIWALKPLSARETLVTLTHDYQAVDDDPEAVRWIRDAVDSNSRAELDKLRQAVEGTQEQAELLLSFEDSVDVDGTRADVYDFLNRAERWPERLPHVARLELREDTPGIQVMQMDTKAADGSVHSTRSIRVCFPESRIVYKQTTLPALMSAHVGEWRLTGRADGGLTVTAKHVVLLKRSAITEVLGEGTTVRKAREFVQRALSGNSTTTLLHAKTYAEARRHG
jgi:aromatase